MTPALRAALALLVAAPSLAGAGEARVAFPGSIGKLAPERELSVTEGVTRLPFCVSLRLRRFAELQARVARGEIIPRGELEAHYLPRAADYQAVADWLRAQGMTLEARDATRLGIFGSAAVDKLQAAFDVRFAAAGALDAPTLPADIAAPVLGIHGLQPGRARRPHLRQPLANNAPAYYPSEILRAYHGNALSAKNVTLTGAGETIAVVIDTPPAAADLTQFWTATGVAQSLSNCAFVQVGGGSPGPASAESTLDAEWASGIAPGASLRVYCAGSLNDVALDRCYQAILNDLPGHPSIHQLSNSVGAGETFTAPAQLDADAQYFAALASQGVSTFVSSGDGGSTPDDLPTGPGNTGPLQVESYACDPSVTGVGGTSLTLDPAAGERVGETAWAGSGGGVSVHFARPAWQPGGGAYRRVPDVSLPADPAKGAYVVYGGVARKFGGTSWGAPTWAGLCALLNQARALHGQPPLGLLNPRIYPLAGTASFFDITSGTNAGGARSVGNYPATAGYDQVTGLGSPDVANLLAALTANPPALEANGVVISQVYGGGGLTGSAFRNDFIELYNRGAAAINLTDYSVQYTSASGNAWSRTLLAGAIQPHAYYLVKEAGAGGASAALPAPDKTGSLDLSATSGKVALVSNQATLPIGIRNPIGNYGVVDFLGYGDAEAFEGAGAGPLLTNAQAAVRAGAGAVDTDQNRDDFSRAAPVPRNSAAPANAPDLAARLTHSGAFKQADPAAACQLVIANLGAVASAGEVAVIFSLPPGLTALSLTGDGWSVLADGHSASRADPLAPGAAYPPLNLLVRVAADAPASLDLTARVSGGGEVNAANNAALDSIAVAPLTASESWRYQHFGVTANAGPAADDAIASGDGLTNLLKYALGLDPHRPALATVSLEVVGDHLRLSVVKNPAASDLVYRAQATGDLGAPGSWTSDGITIEVDTAERLQARDDATVGGGGPRYLRLKVTRP